MTAARIKVRFQHEGWHRWPDATPHRGYLADLHRHLFLVEVETPVGHDDREIEFHDLRDEALALFRRLGDGGGRLGAMSCEMVARTIAAALSERHGRMFKVTVWEDGECGAEVVIV